MPWKSCCFTLDKGFCKYSVQTGIGISLLMFGMGGMVWGDKDNRPYFQNLVSMMFGLFFPHPTPGDNKQGESDNALNNDTDLDLESPGRIANFKEEEEKTVIE